jgi:hypothetical protein
MNRRCANQLGAYRAFITPECCFSEMDWVQGHLTPLACSPKLCYTLLTPPQGNPLSALASLPILDNVPSKKICLKCPNHLNHHPTMRQQKNMSQVSQPSQSSSFLDNVPSNKYVSTITSVSNVPTVTVFDHLSKSSLHILGRYLWLPMVFTVDFQGLLVAGDVANHGVGRYACEDSCGGA